jgi:hypothetical protein
MLFGIFTGDTGWYSLSVFYIPSARITTTFYWSVPIKLTLEEPLTKCNAFRMTNFDYFPFLQTANVISEGHGGKICTSKLFLAFSYCNLFFKMSKSMKRWWDTILQKNPVDIPVPTTGIQAHIPGLIN